MALGLAWLACNAQGLVVAAASVQAGAARTTETSLLSFLISRGSGDLGWNSHTVLPAGVSLHVPTLTQGLIICMHPTLAGAEWTCGETPTH